MIGVSTSPDEGVCGCDTEFDGDRLVVDAGECAGGGRLATEPDCRATVVGALTGRDAGVVLTRTAGRERAYEGEAAALLVAAGRFADAVADRDERLAALAGRDPLRAAREAAGRAGPVARLAAQAGLIEGAERAADYGDVLAPAVGPTVAHSRIDAHPPPDARLADRRTLDTDAVVRVYDRPDRTVRTYHLRPVEASLSRGATATLAAAHARLASGSVEGGDRATGRAVRAVAGPDDPVGTLAAVLEKHARGPGVLADLFADPALSDVFATAPVGDQPLRVRVDGEVMRTNVRLTERGAATLASRFRRASGRAFSRASPTLDAAVEAGGRRVRVAGVTEPASDGLAFAFRAHDGAAWTLPGLVANGTVPAPAAALLSLAAERGAAVLLAGARGAGKTSVLGALLWELPARTRVVVVEDTPELPVARLREAGRDVQRLRVAADDGPELDPSEALRTALRLGEGALVVGEVRGEEAGVLYEAMRVGAADGAVLGTIHGTGGAEVRERVVTDLGVPESAFADTDLVVTLAARGPAGDRARCVTRIEEVLAAEDGTAFAPLYETDDGLAATGRVERGNSRLVAALAGPDGDYADVRRVLDDRAAWLADVAAGPTDPASVAAAHARRRTCR